MSVLTSEKRKTKVSALLIGCALPFIVSGAFWFSPWLGWPTLATAIWFLSGCFLILSSPAAKE